MNINCQPPLQFVYFSTDTHIPWISHNTLRDRLFKNGVAIRKKVYCKRYFQFNVLVFGLATACYVFTKIMRPFTKRWRGMCNKSILYLDDGIGAKSTLEEAKVAGFQIRNDLTHAGFFINEEKTSLSPNRRECGWEQRLTPEHLNLQYLLRKYKN